jgi:aryl-phospho-beta-D-glucosidase BglC (GH1 family)
MTTAGTTRLTIGSTGQITTSSSYTPSTSYDLTTKTYVDTLISGLSTTTLTEGNTNFVVADSGTGTITATVDGTLRLTINGSGITANGVDFVGNLTGNVTGNVSGSAGNVANALTAGTGISFSSGSTYNGSAAITLSIPQAVATTSDVQFDSFGVGTAASGTTGEIRATNQITAYYSDDRLKTKLSNIENALDMIDQLTGFYYEANDLAVSLGYEKIKEVGLSAQDVEKILPEVTAPAPIDPKYLTVRYERIIPLLVEGIKELRKEITSLKGVN